MHPARQQIEFEWGTVSCLEWCPPAAPTGRQKPPVLLLHGGGVDSAELSWGDLGPSLAEAGHRVLAPDHPGYGHSPLPTWPGTQDRLVRYVGEFVEACGLERHVLGGISLGGGMTIGHLLRRPPGVEAALLFGPYGIIQRYGGRLGHTLAWAMQRTGLLHRTMRSGRHRWVMQRSTGSLFRNPDALTPALFEAIMAEASRPDAFRAFSQWHQDQFRWNHLRSDYTGRLSEVGVPTLLVNGEQDRGIPAANARRAAALLPDVELVIVPDAAHWVQRDRRDVVTPTVVDFLRRRVSGHSSSGSGGGT